MKHLGRLITFILLIVNAVFACLLLTTAYSPYANPTEHHLLSSMGLAFPIFLFINIGFLVFWMFVHYKYALFPLVILIICFPQIRMYMPINYTTRDIPNDNIKILSYNVMGFNGLKKINGKNAILDYISESNADIVCVQEYAESNNTEHLSQSDINKALKAYPYKRTQHIGKNNKGNRIATYSKYPILSTRRVGYQSKYNGSMVHEIKINNDTVLLINNHLESNKLTKEDKATLGQMIKDPDANKVKSGATHLIGKLAEASAIRSIQADSIAHIIAHSPYKNIIVCGDFNDTPLSYSHWTISDQLNDAFIESGRGLGISYNQNRFYFRIDHILTSKNIKTYNCTVDRSIKDSDHYPIWCYATIEN